MELDIIASGSAGNCYVLHNEHESLIIEVGVKVNDILNVINYNITDVAGCIVTHEHGDHAKYMKQLFQYSIPVFASAGTLESLKDDGKICESECLHTCKSLEQFKIGNFTILPFDTKHDATMPLGFIISHQETGSILFATDTYYLPYTFKNLSTMMIECNYDLDILQQNVDSGIIHPKVANRVLESHMSLQHCIDAIKSNDISKCRRIILLHRSANNSGGAEHIKNEVEKAIGRSVIVAENGLKMNINKDAF